jgi:hypothetical protein
MNKFNTLDSLKFKHGYLELIALQHWQKEVIIKNNEVNADMLRKKNYLKEDTGKHDVTDELPIIDCLSFSPVKKRDIKN